MDVFQKEIRLSVCIATLNRCQYLMETISKFSAQMLAGVELVVVDGGSNDGTQLRMTAEAAKHPWISYHRLATNGGIDADYDLSVQLAKGQYCWMFSDDDWPLPGALHNILQACFAGHDFIFADAQVRDVDMHEIILHSRAKLTQDHVLEGHEMDALFKLTGSAMSFIGSCVIRRAVWLSRDCKSYYGSYFPHFAVIYQRPLTSTSLLLHQPLIAIRFGNATWTGSSFKIWMLLWPQLIWKMTSISDSVKLSLTPAHPWRSSRRLMWQRAKGVYAFEQYKEYLGRLPMNLLTRLKVMLISRVPGWIALIIAVVAIRLSDGSRKYLLEELKLSKFSSTGFGKWIVSRGW
jgi:abequosyltransferase